MLISQSGILHTVFFGNASEVCSFFCFFSVYIFWAFCAFIDRETVDRIVKGDERVGEDTLQTGHRRDSNLNRQKQVHGVPGC